MIRKPFQMSYPTAGCDTDSLQLTLPLLSPPEVGTFCKSQPLTSHHCCRELAKLPGCQLDSRQRAIWFDLCYLSIDSKLHAYPACAVWGLCHCDRDFYSLASSFHKEAHAFLGPVPA